MKSQGNICIIYCLPSFEKQDICHFLSSQIISISHRLQLIFCRYFENCFHVLRQDLSKSEDLYSLSSVFCLFVLLVSLAGLGMELKSLYMVNKCFATELHPQAAVLFSLNNSDQRPDHNWRGQVSKAWWRGATYKQVGGAIPHDRCGPTAVLRKEIDFQTFCWMDHYNGLFDTLELDKCSASVFFSFLSL